MKTPYKLRHIQQYILLGCIMVSVHSHQAACRDAEDPLRYGNSDDSLNIEYWMEQLEIQEDIPEGVLYNQMIQFVMLGEVRRLRHMLNAHPRLDINHRYEQIDDDGTSYSFTLIHHAAFYGRTNMIEFLIRRGARSNEPDSLGQTLLHLAVIGRGLERTIDLLIGLGAPVDFYDHQGLLAIHHAVYRRDLAIFQRLFTAGQAAGLGGLQPDTAGITILGHAVDANAPDILNRWEMNQARR